MTGVVVSVGVGGVCGVFSTHRDDFDSDDRGVVDTSGAGSAHRHGDDVVC